jgi:hypothetical protein
VTAAAGKGGRNPRRFYELRHESEEFAAAWEEALERGTQVLEEELRRRAVDGWEETTREYRDGVLVRETVATRYSPQLLVVLLKARRPEVYRDNAVVRVTGHEGGPVEIAGYAPPTLADVIRLAGELGVVDAEVVDEVEEADPPALPPGTGEASS